MTMNNFLIIPLKKIIFPLCLLLSTIYSCSEIEEKSQSRLESNTYQLFQLLDPEQTGINFTNTIENKEDFNIFSYRNFYNGGGVSIGDINNDGLPDVYLTSNFGGNKLYLNKGNFNFEDISVSSKIEGTRAWSTGVVMVDINSDGFLDIYVCNAGSIKGDNQKNELFINNGDLTFTEKAQDYNLDENGSTTHAAFFDYDKDGDLDVYILNNSFIPVSSLNFSNKREVRAKDWNVPDLLKGGGDKLLRNDDGKFIDISEEAGIYGSLIGFGLGVTVSDINKDLYPDIYVSNDFYERDYLYINQQDGTFKEMIETYTSHTSLASMGADIQDINNDGLSDIFVTDMLPEDDERLKNTTNFESYDTYQRKKNLDFHNQYMQNVLQLNLGNNTFSDIGFYSDVAKTDWSWGALLFDMDNDGYKDIYVCNGIYHDLTNQDFIDFFANDVVRQMMLTGKKEDKATIIDKMPSTAIPNYAFKNSGDLTFKNKTKDWGLYRESFSNGAAYADLDNDGDLDLVVNNVNQKAFVYKNLGQEKSEKSYIKIQLVGNAPNTFGIGSSIEVFYDDKTIRQELIPTRGFQSSTEYTLTIGLGDLDNIDSLRVIWPNSKFQTITNVKSNQTLLIRQNEAKQIFQPNLNYGKKTFSELEIVFRKHLEDNHIDFNYEGLISKKLSQEGPAVATGDLDGNGYEDFFIGSGKEQEPIVYFQYENKKFQPSNQPILDQEKSFEDTAAAIFDADMDGDLDLLIGSGGNIADDAKNYSNRLYFNDGSGKFTRKVEVPSTHNNVSCIRPFDFDSDGDIDLFIGSRSVPGIYGVDPKHLLLENKGDGNYKNVTESKGYDLKDIGMVTDASWADLDGDNISDLIIVGDWQSPKILKNYKGRLALTQSSLDSIYGWYNTILIEDLNSDSKLDLLLGNSGANIPYKPSMDSPIKLFINDFDDNGSIEQISTQYLDGKDRPIILKKELTGQIASLKKNSLTNAEYAKKGIADLFQKDILENSIVKKVTESKSLIAYNLGNGKFDIVPLPKEAQFTSVNAFYCADFNKDGFKDILFGGNDYELKPQYSRLDALHGGFLRGGPNKSFSWVPYNKSGFFVDGEIKSIHGLYNQKETKDILISRNNMPPLIFNTNE